VAGLLVDAAGLVPGQAPQSPATAERIGALYGLLPAGLLLGAAFAMRGYGLGRTRVRAIQAELLRRRGSGG
jgi:Na+/melibiose symporter-like transporter